jgi:hypothetical protein
MGPETTRGLLYIKPPVHYDLYDPVRNAFDAGRIHNLVKLKGVGSWKSRLFRALWKGLFPLTLVMDAGPIKSITHEAVWIIGA